MLKRRSNQENKLGENCPYFLLLYSIVLSFFFIFLVTKLYHLFLRGKFCGIAFYGLPMITCHGVVD